MSKGFYTRRTKLQQFRYQTRITRDTRDADRTRNASRVFTFNWRRVRRNRKSVRFFFTVRIIYFCSVWQTNSYAPVKIERHILLVVLIRVDTDRSIPRILFAFHPLTTYFRKFICLFRRGASFFCRLQCSTVYAEFIQFHGFLLILHALVAVIFSNRQIHSTLMFDFF